MRIIKGRKCKIGEIYCFYQKSFGCKYLAFSRVVDHMDGKVYLTDIMKYLFRGDGLDYTVAEKNLYGSFFVSYFYDKEDIESNNSMLFFEISEDEIVNHIVMKEI